VLAYYATRDLIPFYGVYTLYFADHGLTPTAISTLLVIWSLTGFVLEIPSGAWADIVDRRLLLVLSGVGYVAAFTTWLAWPTYAGLALGFVLWGASSSAMSGTFEALLHDELTARGRAADYPRLLGWAHSAAMAAVLVAMLSAAPLYALGGYALVGWTSVAVAALHTALATLLPPAPPAVSSPGPGPGPGGGYRAMLRAGVHEAVRHRAVRGAVVVCALVVGCSALDEYFPLVARDHGASTAQVAVVVGVIAGFELLGTALAGRAAAMSSRTMAVVVTLAGVALALGCLVGPLGLTTLAIGVGYGLLGNAMVVAEARLQAVISGPARATVTSVAGISTELVALSVYAFVAVGSLWWSTAIVLATWALPMLCIALVSSRMLPEVPDPHVEADDTEEPVSG
jgi:hypothetical protein